MKAFDLLRTRHYLGSPRLETKEHFTPTPFTATQSEHIHVRDAHVLLLLHTLIHSPFINLQSRIASRKLHATLEDGIWKASARNQYGEVTCTAQSPCLVTAQLRALLWTRTTSIRQEGAVEPDSYQPLIELVNKLNEVIDTPENQ